MSASDRRAMLSPGDGELSLRHQCRLLGLARSGVYYQRRPANDNDLGLMRRLDELFTQWPFLGSRRLARMLRGEGLAINRKRVQRLMRKMGIAALGPKPRTTKPAPGHKIYPYLLRDLVIDRPNQVWAADITYIPIGRGFLYLVAIMDWASRAVLSWRLSNTMDASFCVEALEEALARFGKPEIFNTDQGSQFTGGDFTGTLISAGVRISNGWPRAVDGQRVHRATVALVEVRGHLSQGLRRRPRGQGGHRPVGRLLQHPSPAYGTRASHADGRVARRHYRRPRRHGCGHDAALWRAAHMPTAATTADHDSLRRFRGEERPGFQLRNRQNWS
jgi:putative transposase